MPSQLTLRLAAPNEADRLTNIALRSKQYWGYSREFMASCRAELTVDSKQILNDQYEYLVAEDRDTIVGFYAITAVSPDVFELEAMFVEPEYVGSGVGRALIEHAVRNIAAKGGETLLVQSDPNASEFYTAAGAVQIGTRESESIAGRILPLLKIDTRTVN